MLFETGGRLNAFPMCPARNLWLPRIEKNAAPELHSPGLIERQNSSALIGFFGGVI